MAAEVDTENLKVRKSKRSRRKLLLLSINVLLFITGATCFLLTKLGIVTNIFVDAWGPQAGPSAPVRSAVAASVETTSEELQSIRHRLILLLSGKAFDEISTVEGKYQLRGEIRRDINDVLGTALVEKIYFTEFVFQ